MMHQPVPIGGPPSAPHKPGSVRDRSGGPTELNWTSFISQHRLQSARAAFNLLPRPFNELDSLPSSGSATP